MKKLSRNEMKNVMGGSAPEDDKACTKNSDCGSKTLTCNGQSTEVSGTCKNGKCWWAAGC